MVWGVLFAIGIAAIITGFVVAETVKEEIWFCLALAGIMMVVIVLAMCIKSEEPVETEQHCTCMETVKCCETCGKIILGE